MRVPNIKDVMREQATFVKYQDQKLWYQILYTESGVLRLFDFPVPVDDAGGGEFGPVEKAMTLMRWIRKHIEYLNEVTSGQT